MLCCRPFLGREYGEGDTFKNDILFRFKTMAREIQELDIQAHLKCARQINLSSMDANSVAGSADKLTRRVCNNHLIQIGVSLFHLVQR